MFCAYLFEGPSVLLHKGRVQRGEVLAYVCET